MCLFLLFKFRKSCEGVRSLRSYRPESYRKQAPAFFYSRLSAPHNIFSRNVLKKW